MKPGEGRKRVVLEAVTPQVDCGRYAVRRFLGDTVTVRAAIFGDGHDHVAGRVLYRQRDERRWRCTPMTPEGNDLWSAAFPVDQLGPWQYAVQGWIDHIGTWRADLAKRLAAQTPPVPGSETIENDPPPATNTVTHQDVLDPSEPGDRIARANSFGADPAVPSTSEIPLALRTGARLLNEVAARATGADATTLRAIASSLEAFAEENLAFYDAASLSAVLRTDGVDGPQEVIHTSGPCQKTMKFTNF